MTPKVILVTGSSSGFGLTLIKEILSKGDIAIATLRNPSVLDDFAKDYTKEQLLVLPLDVTKKDQVAAAFQQVKEVFGRLDVVISNAGWASFGEVEFTPEEDVQKMFDINFFGHMNVVRESLAFFRDVNEPGKGGRIVYVSSLVGLVAYPGNGIYAASKHAAEAAMEGMSKELDPAWNIKISIIEPGVFNTGVLGRLETFPIPPAYNNPALPTVQFRQGLQAMKQSVPPIAADPVKGAKAMLKVSEMDDPPLRLVLAEGAYLGAKAKWTEFLESMEKHKDLSLDVAYDTPEDAEK